MIIILLSISIVILSSSFCHVYSFTPSNIGSPFLLLVQSRSKSIYNLSSSDNNSNINTNNNSDDDPIGASNNKNADSSSMMNYLEGGIENAAFVEDCIVISNRAFSEQS